MVYIRSRKFCCCLPVRFGVFIMALLSMGLGGLAAIGGWLEVRKIKQHGLSKRDEVSLYIQTVVYTLLAVMSLFGLVGTFIQRRAFVSAYANLIAFHLGFHLIAGALSIYSLFHQNAERVRNCVNGINGTLNDTDGNEFKKDVCEIEFAILRGLAIGIYVLVVLVELYGYIIVSNYVEQLDEEKAAKIPKMSTIAFNNASISNPLPQTTYNSYSGSANYPFGAQDHSHGSGGAV